MNSNEPLNEKQKRLVAENHNLIYGYALQKNLPIDDYYDILAIGLCKAAKAYDGCKGEFSTVAYRCMQNELYTHWNANKKQSSIPQDLIVSYNTPMFCEDFNNGNNLLENLLDLKSHNDIMYSMMSSEIKDCLTARENMVLNLLRIGFTHSEIADKLGCHKSNVTYFAGRIRNKIKQYFGNN